MSDPITPPITADSDELAQIAYDNLAGNMPGWLPANGAPTTRLIQAFAAIVAEWAILAGQVPQDLVRFFGTFMLGVPPREATTATVPSTWTMLDNAGHTIDAGTRVGLPDGQGGLIAFAVATDVTVPAGSTATAAGEVLLIAVTPGAAGSGLSGPVTLIDGVGGFVDPSGIALTAITTGGQDAETTDAYLRRYGDIAPLISPMPITTSDFELFARAFEPEVFRALALEGYQPSDDTTGHTLMTSVAVISITGDPISTGGKTDLVALIQAKRGQNYSVHVIDGTYTLIDVTYAGKALAGYDPVDVQARTDAAVAAVLDPALHGLPPEGDQQGWIDQPTIRFQDIVTALNNTPGFDYYTALTIGIHGGALGGGDIALDGPAGLPRPGTISGAVTAP